jgi:hypothetical protein
MSELGMLSEQKYLGVDLTPDEVKMRKIDTDKYDIFFPSICILRALKTKTDVIDVKLLEKAKSTYNDCCKEIVVGEFKTKEIGEELEEKKAGNDGIVSLRSLARKRFYTAWMKKQPYPLEQWVVIVTKVERCFVNNFLTTLPMTTQTELQTQMTSESEKDLSYMSGKITEKYPLIYVPRSDVESWYMLFSQVYAQHRKVTELDVVLRGRDYVPELIGHMLTGQPAVAVAKRRREEMPTLFRHWVATYATDIVWQEIRNMTDKNIMEQKQFITTNKFWEDCCLDVFADYTGRKLTSDEWENIINRFGHPTVRLNELLELTQLSPASLMVIVSMIERRFIEHLLVKFPSDLQKQLDTAVRITVLKQVDDALAMINVQRHHENRPPIAPSLIQVVTTPPPPPPPPHPNAAGPTAGPMPMATNPTLKISMYGKPVVPLQFMEAEPVDPFATQQQYLDWWSRRLARGIAETKQVIHNATHPPLPPPPPPPPPTAASNSAATPMQFGGGARIAGHRFTLKRFKPKIFYRPRR